MATCTYYRQGGRFGWFYDMAAGERIPQHSHSWEMYHTILCVRGMVEVNGETLLPGDMLMIDSGIAHEIVALGPARVFNQLLHGDAGFDYPDGHVVDE